MQSRESCDRTPLWSGSVCHSHHRIDQRTGNPPGQGGTSHCPRGEMSEELAWSWITADHQRARQVREGIANYLLSIDKSPPPSLSSRLTTIPRPRGRGKSGPARLEVIACLVVQHDVETLCFFIEVNAQAESCIQDLQNDPGCQCTPY